MKQLLSIYKKFVTTSVAVETSFRTSFILLILMDICFFSSVILSVDIIFDHVDYIGPWSKDQMLFFMSYMLMIDNLHMMIFSQSFWEFSFNLRMGQMDYIILKPASTIFSVFFRHFRLSSCFNTPLFLGALLYFGSKLQFSFLTWCLIPIFLILSMTLLVLIEFCLSALMFWMIEGNGINFLRMQLQQLGRWPHFIYQSLARKVFIFFIPVLAVGSSPVHIILDQPIWWLTCWMILAIIIFYFFLRFIWNLGLKQYESASS